MTQLQFTKKISPLSTARQELDSLLKYPAAVLLIRLCVFILGIQWIMVGGFYRFLPPYIPLWFSKPWGMEQLTYKYWIFLIPILLTVLFGLNVRLASLALRRENLLSILLLWAQLISSVLGGWTVAQVILLLA